MRIHIKYSTKSCIRSDSFCTQTGVHGGWSVISYLNVQQIISHEIKEIWKNKRHPKKNHEQHDFVFIILVGCPIVQKDSSSRVVTEDNTIQVFFFLRYY